jgi:hypothetical protein
MTANETDPDTGTRSTRPEAPAEAASDAPTGNPSQPRPTLPEGMGELDRRAIDTVRVLAMDAVQKAGNGHPGTAMSVGPTAYLLFQKWLRHDPGDPDWVGRDRFVLSMGHSSLTLYIQLFLSGYGLELSDLEALRTWGSRTPGHPEVNHTPAVETTTGPLGQGVGNTSLPGLAPEPAGAGFRFASTLATRRPRLSPGVRRGRSRVGFLPGERRESARLRATAPLPPAWREGQRQAHERSTAAISRRFSWAGVGRSWPGRGRRWVGPGMMADRRQMAGSLQMSTTGCAASCSPHACRRAAAGWPGRGLERGWR